MSGIRSVNEKELFEEVLPLVSKPNRYVGNELGLIEKKWEETSVRFLLSYPDTYEVGMSHTGTQILYHLVNRNPRWLLDRVYAPWPDMEEQLRMRNMPLWGLHYRREVREYDVLGFTLQSELTYTNLLNMIDLAGISIRQVDREESDPLICIGGPCASNPEPLAPFVDFALIGDAEDALAEVLELVEDWKKTRGQTGETREAFLQRLAVSVSGIYVPSLYHQVGGNLKPVPRDGVDPQTPAAVMARKVPVLKTEDHPREMVVSMSETTHDRLPIEVMRGCMRGCRFCQAGYLYRPSRERDVDEVLEIADEGIKHSGWQEVSMLSLSTADYSQAPELTDRLSRTMVEKGVGVSLPSLRADEFSVGLAESVSRVRKSGFTFAPEAGSQRLRNVINKGLSEEEILSAVERAMASGWTSVKLYLMIGHPTECEADFEELAELVEKIRAITRAHKGRRYVTLGISPFVPKAHTPFQWEQQDSMETNAEKLSWVKSRLKGKGIEIRHHDTADTAIEGLISRGDRRVGDVIESAWRNGARFDGWSEYCRFSNWEKALQEHGLDLKSVFEERSEDNDLPWEIVSYGIDRAYFLKERHKAYEAGETEECKNERCSACGVCDFQVIKNLLAPPTESPKPEMAPQLLRGVAGTHLRLGYRKGEHVRFISHLELMRELERTFRRAELPLIFSEGFSPRPKMASGAPLALGWTSECEWIDVQLAGEWALEEKLDELLKIVNEKVASGVEFFAAAAMSGKLESLSAGLTRCTYHVEFPGRFETTLGELEASFSRLLALDSVTITRTRKRKVQNIEIRPMIADISVVSSKELLITIESGISGSVKPTEIIGAAMDIEEKSLPLVKIQKIRATTGAGESPVASAVVLVEVEKFEKRNTNNWRPAGDPRGHSGG